MTIGLVRALGGHEVVNEFTADTLGLERTALEPYQQGFHMGYTTPLDRLKVLRYMNASPNQDSPLPAPLELLEHVSDGFGIRRHLPSDVVALVKSGSYNNADQDGRVRHDVGYLIGSKNEKLLVVAMSKSPPGQTLKTKAAEWWLGEVGVELADHIGGEQALRRRQMIRHLGGFGLRLGARSGR
jgi:Beta-lactamase enzyme family